MNKLTIKQLHQGLIKKEFSSQELTKSFLKRIESRDKKIGAFLSVFKDSALDQAEKIDKLIAEKKELPILAGIPTAIKDNILVAGEKCTSGSKILENYIASFDATVIKKLKEQGTIILGKTNLDEFAMGSSTENSYFGPTRNPRDLERVPGGSSGGSAAAVADDMCAYALGSDTGGSIRQPASFCGVVGLKPTYGTVSRYGLMAFASSLDQIGPLTKTVEDAKIVFEGIRGRDPKDSTSLEKEETEVEIKNLRVGVPKEYFVEGIDPEVEKTVKEAIKKYEKRGAIIEEISLPHASYALPVYYIISPSEASSNLARYDGIKYGLSKRENAENLLDIYLQSRGEGMGKEVRRRIMLGTYVLSAGYYDAYYIKAQKVRNLIKQDFNKAFEKVDVIFTPVSPTVAFKLGEKATDPLSMYLVDIYTISVNLAGLPALSLPCGTAHNLPVGLQIIGKPFGEDKIFTAGQAVEKDA
ncbi:MAG: Asp-tRNA(Asn)/Glu-tRNA(Gln) amidotransferase subunit GatA [bacterium]